MDRDVRVAMLVLNPFHNDARVLRAATALRRQGAVVRVFASSAPSLPAGLEQHQGITVHRLDVRSPPLRVVEALPVGARRVLAVSGAGSCTTPASAPRASRDVAGSTAWSRTRGRLAWATRSLLRAARRLALPVHRTLVTTSYTRAATAAVTAWGPDVVHAHDLNTLLAGRLSSRRVGAKLIYDSHELWRYRNRHGQLRPLARVVECVAERRLVRVADAVITVSPSIARWLARHYQVPDRVHLVRNVPPRRIDASDRSGLHALPEQRVVVYTGRFMPGRGLELAIRALTLLPDDVVLRGFGYGEPGYGQQLLRLAGGLGVGNRVRLLPPVPPDRVPVVAAAADVALVAIQPTCLSYRYSLPNKLFEAVQAGIPVVATNLPDLADVVERHGLGITVPAGSWQALAAGLRSVLDAVPAYAPPDSAQRDLCWEHEAERLLECYASIGVCLRSGPTARMRG